MDFILEKTIALCSQRIVTRLKECPCFPIAWLYLIKNDYTFLRKLLQLYAPEEQLFANEEC